MATYGIPESRSCTKCGEVKPIEMFAKRKIGLYGRQSMCKPCHNSVSYEARQKKHKEYCDKSKELTQELALHLFDYIDGVLYWKNPTHPKIEKGTKVGYKNDNGYVKVSIGGKKYLAHQIVYLMFKSVIPKEIDHINRVREDNRIENLREVTRQQNMLNRVDKKSKTGCKNVFLHEKLQKYEVSVSINGKRTYIGLFEDLEFADLVAQEARDKFHGEYANHGR